MKYARGTLIVGTGRVQLRQTLHKVRYFFKLSHAVILENWIRIRIERKKTGSGSAKNECRSTAWEKKPGMTIVYYARAVGHVFPAINF